MFHMTLQNHVIKGPCDFMEESSSLYIPTLPNSVATDIVLVDILVSHAISWLNGHPTLWVEATQGK